MTHDIKVAVSIGDPNGIGPEVIMKTFSDARILEDITPVIYGSSRLFNKYRKVFPDLEFNFHSIKSASEAKPKKLNLVSTLREEYEIQFGEKSSVAGKIALQSLEAATQDIASGLCDVLVTAPIDKKVIQSENFQFPGHTEYLASMSGVNEALMFMVSEGLRVGVCTGHIALKEVAAAISKEKILSKIEQISLSLKRDFGIGKPKIAVLGLNPHAGEKGLMGTEEQDIISPAISAANEKGIFTYGPYPADGFFGSSAYKQFDAVLAMYHDQGLAPFKSVAFGYGVNFTAGLPIVRTSPDHGTAFEIAGKGLASEASFRSAVYLAVDVFRNRKLYKEITANPLKTNKLERDRGE
jgi:4-hydroxythreonine-4-phosphate dehydrogenase